MSLFPDHMKTNHITMGVTNLFGVLLQSSQSSRTIIAYQIPLFDASNVNISPYLPGESFLKDLHPKIPWYKLVANKRFMKEFPSELTLVSGGCKPQMIYFIHLPTYIYIHIFGLYNSLFPIPIESMVYRYIYQSHGSVMGFLMPGFTCRCRFAKKTPWAKVSRTVLPGQSPWGEPFDSSLRMDGWMDEGGMGGWMDEWMDTPMRNVSCYLFSYSAV